MSLALIFQVLASFASPLALNRILSYAPRSVLFFWVLISIRFIESDGQGALISPWFWVLCLFIAPLIMSICFQWYLFMATRALACADGLLTQLVFEHSLRIRFKAEGSREDDPSTVPVDTSEAQTVEGSTTLEASSTQSNATKGKAKADDSTAKSAGRKEKKKDNLIGRINTLVTVDLKNIVSARDFLMVSK